MPRRRRGNHTKRGLRLMTKTTGTRGRLAWCSLVFHCPFLSFSKLPWAPAVAAAGRRTYSRAFNGMYQDHHRRDILCLPDPCGHRVVVPNETPTRKTNQRKRIPPLPSPALKRRRRRKRKGRQCLPPSLTLSSPHQVPRRRRARLPLCGMAPIEGIALVRLRLRLLFLKRGWSIVYRHYG